MKRNCTNWTFQSTRHQMHILSTKEKEKTNCFSGFSPSCLQLTGVPVKKKKKKRPCEGRLLYSALCK